MNMFAALGAVRTDLMVKSATTSSASSSLSGRRYMSFRIGCVPRSVSPSVSNGALQNAPKTAGYPLAAPDGPRSAIAFISFRYSFPTSISPCSMSCISWPASGISCTRFTISTMSVIGRSICSGPSAPKTRGR